MCSIQSKGDSIMLNFLTTATAVIMLALTATGVAHPINYHHHHLHAGYAGPMYSQASRLLRPGNVPGRTIAGIAPQFNSSSLQIKGYGCVAHPDYGLYIPRFC
jgi:hypothetical protein